MAVPKFDEREMVVKGIEPGFFGGPESPMYSYPVTPKEAVIAMMKKEPVWQITGTESRMFSPRVYPDHVARGFVYDGTGPNPTTGGPDMFGIEWEYVAQVGGSMVRPGKPFVEDANEIKDKVVWPDIEKWDWEAAAKANEGYLSDNKFNCCWHLNGWYERLISFMDFENAIMAIFDEDQQDAVHAFFDQMTDLYISIFEKYLIYFPKIDGFCIHDDWGSQKETFFSPAVAEEMIVPYMKRVTDYLHSRGRFCELHSCGQLLKQVPNMIKAGWDSWNGQPMNDTHKIYELYGDQIIIGVIPDMYDPATKSEEEQKAAAIDFANKFCQPGRPSMMNHASTSILTPAFKEGLYRQSRINYSK